MTARLLAFDTSTERLAVAVSCATGRWHWEGDGGAQASAALIPRIHRLLGQAGLALAQLDAIAFGRGPGAFTGLRTSCAVAQGLAFGANRPVLPLDSLLLVAEDARAQVVPDPAEDFEVDVVMDARMGEIYAAAYAWRGGHWHTRRAPALLAPPVLQAWWSAQAPRCVAGSALAVFGSALHTAPARVVAREADRPSALMRLAQGAWRDARAVDAADALPLYLRDRVALTVAERQAQRTAAGGGR